MLLSVRPSWTELNLPWPARRNRTLCPLAISAGSTNRQLSTAGQHLSEKARRNLPKNAQPTLPHSAPVPFHVSRFTNMNIETNSDANNSKGSLHYFIQPAILQQIGARRLAKLLDGFRDDLKAANIVLATAE